MINAGEKEVDCVYRRMADPGAGDPQPEAPHPGDTTLVDNTHQQEDVNSQRNSDQDGKVEESTPQVQTLNPLQQKEGIQDEGGGAGGGVTSTSTDTTTRSNGRRTEDITTFNTQQQGDGADKEHGNDEDRAAGKGINKEKGSRRELQEVRSDKNSSSAGKPGEGNEEASTTATAAEADDSEWSQLRCGSQCTEELAQKQKQKEERRNRREAASGGGGKAGRPDYPGFAFGSAMFSSDATMKFNIIKNELHNIMKSQLKRVDGEVNAFANRIKEFDLKLEESEKFVRLATAALADVVALQIEVQILILCYIFLIMKHILNILL
jgi:hypothetical protein